MEESLLGKLQGKIKFAGGGILGKLTELAKEAVANGLSLKLDEDTIVATAKDAFDKWIRPVNWPFVPEPFESQIEDAAWALCEATIRAAIKD